MKAWFLAGSQPREYAHGLVEGERLDGKRVAFLRCVADQPTGFGTVMQEVAADEFCGQRVRLSGRLRALATSGGAGFWMRVDGVAPSRPLAFSRARRGDVTGTTGWQRDEVVLDVAVNALQIAFGFKLEGSGAVEVADLTFETVGDDVPTTERSKVWPRPQNLDFSEE